MNITDEMIVANFRVEEIIRKYPRSGQKQVLQVKHAVHGDVIMKIVQGDNARISREIEIVNESNLDHVPKVIEVFDYAIDNETGICIFEEYIRGENLREILDKKKQLSLQKAIHLAKGVLSIIVQMEAKGIVHRDIKPANILRSVNNEWYLLDFGIARALDKTSLTLTEVQTGPHTPGYGAPELFQYSKKDIDSRADIFSLGVVLFEAVTGKHPFVRGDEMNLNEIWYNTITILPDSIVINGDVDMQFMGLIQTFMQKHTTRRPKTATKAAEWLKSVEDHISEGGE